MPAPRTFIGHLPRRIALLAASLIVLLLSLNASSAAVAEPRDDVLTLTPETALTATNEGVGLTVSGSYELLRRLDAEGVLTGTRAAAPVRMTARVYGPVGRADVGLSVSRLPDPQIVGLTPASPTSDADPAVGSSSGQMSVDVDIPAAALERPGAYLVTVVLTSGEVVVAKGSRWLGRVSAGGTPLEIACVWPIVQGVHRDPDGMFFDDGIADALMQSATTGGEQSWGAGAIAALSEVREAFPGWHFTLALEPILLTQMAEMSDGYVLTSTNGEREEVVASDERAQRAAAALVALKALSVSGGTDVVTAPYAGASAAALASLGWDDGIEQVRLGKQTLQRALSLEGLITGGFSPDIDLSTQSVAVFSRASLDHVLVDDDLSHDLAEPPTKGAVTARVHDGQGERITLVFVEGELSRTLGVSTDMELFWATFAARLAETGADAVVLMPPAADPVPAVSFLEGLGAALTGSEQMRSVTLEELVRTHAPGSRPVYLDRPSGTSTGYVAASLTAAAARARAAVEALAHAAGDAVDVVDRARVLLYTAESVWWSRPGVDPRTATMGLRYALDAERIADEELGEVEIVGAKGDRVMGRTGVLALEVENRASYPLSVEVSLQGDGLTVTGPYVREVELPQGRTQVTVEVTRAPGEHRLQARLLAGERAIDQWSHSVEFVTVATVLPWAVSAVVVLIVLLAGLLLLRGRGKRAEVRSSGPRT